MVLCAERAGSLADVGRAASQVVIFVGSVLLTVGLAGVALDVLRLRAVILQPPLRLEDVVARDQHAHAGGVR